MARMAPDPDPVYLDANATTRPAPEVVEAMLPHLRERFANPSSAHAAGVRARRDVEAARDEVAALAGADPAEVVFTSGGTEAIATALRGAVADLAGAIVTTAVEHAATRGALARLAAEGRCEVATVPVDAAGALDLDALDRALEGRRRIALVTLLHANNETGLLFPVDEVARRCRARGALLHVDAVQAAGKVAIDLARLGADLVSISAHKLHGPKGAGALVVRRGVRVPPLLAGHQEGGRRGGTEDVAAIAGFGVAARLARAWLATDGPARLAALRDRLEARLLAIPGAARNGAARPRVASTASLRFEGVDGAALVLELSRRGVHAATGAACSSGALEPSHVLLAMGLSPEEARGSLRLSLSRETTAAEVDRAAREVEDLVPRLRKLGAAAIHVSY
jgi:cysteine desulfurase